LESNKIDIPSEIRDLIKKMHPSDRNEVARVLSVLENDYWRDTNKIYFGIIDGEQTWAVAEGGFTVAFVEEEGGTIFICYLSKRSRFRPGWL
jgi:hypothetical protein